MIDIALVSPPSRMDNHYRPPLGLMYVANYYKERGLSVKIIDIPMQKVVRDKTFWQNRTMAIRGIKQQMLEQIQQLDPITIGISCYSPEFAEVKDFIKCVKEITRARIIVGGIHPTLYPNDFDRLSDSIHKGRCDNGTASYAEVDMSYYSNANPYAIRGIYLRCAYVLSSFGCPSQCTFCVAKNMRPHFGIETFKSPESLGREIHALKVNYDIDGFYFIDDLFTINKQRTLDFCNIIRKERLLWGCSSKVSTIDSDTVKAMAKAGCVQIDFGIERGSDEALRKVKKGITIEQVKKAFRLCKKNRIRTFANFLAGLPEESGRGREDIELLIEQIRPTVVSINKFTPYQGTDIYNEGFRIENNTCLDQWIMETMKKYNSVWRNIGFVFDTRYLGALWRSKRKANYLQQLSIVAREAVNQSFQ